jgi:putative acetyltransferase
VIRVPRVAPRTTGKRWAIRPAVPDDRAAILAVVRDAFSNDGRDGSEEISIVQDTWSVDAVPDGFELVAVEDGEVLGHVLPARGDLGGRDVVGIAPLAVTSERQGQGLGTALMTELLHKAQDARLPLVVLLGHPAYYARFGFEPSGPLGISYRPVGAGNPNFQVCRLAAYDPSFRGQFTYCWETRID